MKPVLLFIAFVSILNAARNDLFFDQTNLNPHNTPFPDKTLADSIPPDSSGMDTVNSFELSQKMVPGWNLGNTLEALPNETSWGNPLTTQKIMDSVKAAGFNSVRIPVAWSKFIDDTSTYTIDQTWLDRVEQVVNYALNAGLYAIINEHWDNGWQIPSYADSAYVNRRLAAMWLQIALQFRDYDSHLLFAGTNEIHMPNVYSAPTAENSKVQNGFNQIFVNTVRSTGGRNYYRYLIVQGYNTNIDNTKNYFIAPADSAPNRLLVEVHYYDPYNFTLNTDDKIIRWGDNASHLTRTETWANESYADNQFQKMKTKFVDKGIGVILGEYGATIRTNLGSDDLNAEYEKYRVYYMQYITRSIERHGLVPYYWDVGYYGNHGSGLFDRTSGAHVYTDILEAITDTNKVNPVVGVAEPPSALKSFFLGQNYPNPFNPSTIITYEIPAVSYVILKIYNILGREVSTLVNGIKNPGRYEVKFDAGNLMSGIYLYRLQAGRFTETRKLIVLK
ncbi:MAG TPA: cellulase family glycosylhydrolase [Ignavibacteriaceae bacterium]|nr:cellulase family glycosylhydrolase [Ignavibacteriaceae bacterium]